MVPTLQEGGQGCPGSRVEFRVVHLPVVNVVHDPAGDLLAEFHTPLVEGVYLPYSGLHENAVLVGGQQRSECKGRELIHHDHADRPVSRYHLVGHESLADTCCGHFFTCQAHGQNGGLGQRVSDKDVVLVVDLATGLPIRRCRSGREDDVAADVIGPLVQQLEEGMLAIRPWFAPVDGAGAIGDR